jgi:hypothetical protein
MVELKKIHTKFFNDEFSLPDFLKNYLCAVTVEDAQGIITVGGVRNIAEAVAITNKDRSVRDRRDALMTLWRAFNYIAQAHNHKELHAFIQDETWLKHLLNAGFRRTKGIAVVTEV